jgi:hypothetical protein
LVPTVESDTLSPRLAENGVHDVGSLLSDTASNPPQTVPFDLTEARERQRGRLATLGFVLFSIVILMLMVPVIAGLRTWDQVQGLAAAILPTVSSIVSAAVVFYYSATKEK